MRRSLQQLFAVFVLLACIAWWIVGRVAVSGSVREFFLGGEESSTPPEASPGEQEKALVQKALAELPPPPAEHSPEVAELIFRLGELQAIPAILVNAVKRDRDTPKDLTPISWSEAELEALKSYQAKFRNAWEPFFSGPQPDWEKFPDSAIFFRSQFPPWRKEYADFSRYGFYEPEQPQSWSSEAPNQQEFFLRLFRQITRLGTLRFGSLSGWAVTDTVNGTKLMEEMIRKSDYFFSSDFQDPDDFLALLPPAPTVATLRDGLKTDRAVFLKTAQYLESLPQPTPAEIALTRILGDESDASWFVEHVDSPKTAPALAAILRQAADQIRLLEQKTYLTGPAWRQWLTGDLNDGLSPALRGTLEGIRDFEQTTLQYQVSLAFLQASSAYRKSGLEGIKNIPDPARPGSFLIITTSTNGITLSSAFQPRKGKVYNFTFQAPPSP